LFCRSSNRPILGA